MRAARIARDLSQVELARRAGISRQALSAIESGLYQPSVAVALGLARELGQTVESLFGANRDDDCLHLDARFEPGKASPKLPARPQVVLGRVAGKLVALPQSDPHLNLCPAAGILETARPHRAAITTYRSQDEIDSTLLIAGCDPSVTLLADFLARNRSPVRLAAHPCSSSRALALLIDRSVHVAGAHLKDPATENYNLAATRRAFGNRRALLVNFARWELGLATAPGNPLKLHQFADLARPAVRLVNRERGSGARSALDEALRKLGTGTGTVTGYDTEVSGHLEVAATIAARHADLGVTLRVAAEAYGLHFIPLREERYDLVISEADADTAPVKAMLDALNSSRLAREVSQFCSYDTRQMGQLISPPS